MVPADAMVRSLFLVALALLPCARTCLFPPCCREYCTNDYMCTDFNCKDCTPDLISAEAREKPDVGGLHQAAAVAAGPTAAAREPGAALSRLTCPPARPRRRRRRRGAAVARGAGRRPRAA